MKIWKWIIYYLWAFQRSHSSQRNLVGKYNTRENFPQKKRATRLSNGGLLSFAFLLAMYFIIFSLQIPNSTAKKQHKKIVYKINKFYQRLLQWIQMEMGKEFSIYVLWIMYFMCVYRKNWKIRRNKKRYMTENEISYFFSCVL